MKLIFCPECQDVVRLFPGEMRKCHCGNAFGHYENGGIHALVGGSAVPLGFLNSSFAAALRERPLRGDGRRFDAFVIPVDCPTVHYITMVPQRGDTL